MRMKVDVESTPGTCGKCMQLRCAESVAGGGDEEKCVHRQIGLQIPATLSWVAKDYPFFSNQK